MRWLVLLALMTECADLVLCLVGKLVQAVFIEAVRSSEKRVLPSHLAGGNGYYSEKDEKYEHAKKYFKMHA